MKILITTICLTFVLSLANSANASSLEFNPEKIPSQYNSELAVAVRISTDGKYINAVRGKIMLTEQSPKIKEIRDANSAVSFWIERPSLQDNKIISFSGTMPGGFVGQDTELFTIIFETYQQTADGVVSVIEDSEILLNDGRGTTDRVTVNQLIISQAVNFDTVNPNTITDNISPEVFSPQVSRSTELFNNQWFIVFDTQDKQSGISHYEIQETTNGKIREGAWLTVTSPYLLTDQQLQSYIYVIAVDNQGNERVIKVFPRNPLSWFAVHRSEIVVTIILIASVIVTYFVTNNLHKKNDHNV